VHSNVGGGYDDQQIANITLAWMMAQFAPFLDMCPDYILRQENENIHYYRTQHKKVQPWSFGTIYNSMTGMYVLGGSTTRTPGKYYAVDPDTGQATERPLRDTCEYMHPSVRARIRLHGPGPEDHGRYDPKFLDDWTLVIKYQDGKDKKPSIYWKATFEETNVSTRMLPECPLWSFERQLLGMYKEMEGYVSHPPPTGESWRDD
jgi:hypothetical protein